MAGFAADSGTAGLLAAPPSTTNFTYVAHQVNCTQTDEDDQFACMQLANASKIIAILNNYNATENGGAGLPFVPVPDNETSFSNYTDLQVHGNFAQLPLLVGNNNNESASLVPYNPAHPNETAIALTTNGSFDCPAALAAQARAESNVTVWRYRYLGTFPNVNPLPWQRRISLKRVANCVWNVRLAWSQYCT